MARREILDILLRYKAKGACHLRLAEQADAGRISTNGGDVGSESVHSSSHTNISCGTVEVIIDKIGILVCFLRIGRERHKRQCCQTK